MKILMETESFYEGKFTLNNDGLINSLTKSIC